MLGFQLVATTTKVAETTKAKTALMIRFMDVLLVCLIYRPERFISIIPVIMMYVAQPSEPCASASAGSICAAFCVAFFGHRVLAQMKNFWRLLWISAQK